MKAKAMTAALIGAAVAVGDGLRDTLSATPQPGAGGRRRGGNTRMSRGRGIRLNMLQLRNLPATPAKINWRRSDPHHDQHHRYCGLAQPCTDKQGMEERVARHEASA